MNFKTMLIYNKDYANFFGKISLSLSLSLSPIELSAVKQYSNQYQEIQREDSYVHECFIQFDLSLRKGWICKKYKIDVWERFNVNLTAYG